MTGAALLRRRFIATPNVAAMIGDGGAASLMRPSELMSVRAADRHQRLQ
jgi:hypothetical protein